MASWRARSLVWPSWWASRPEKLNCFGGYIERALRIASCNLQPCGAVSELWRFTGSDDHRGDSRSIGSHLGCGYTFASISAAVRREYFAFSEVGRRGLGEWCALWGRILGGPRRRGFCGPWAADGGASATEWRSEGGVLWGPWFIAIADACVPGNGESIETRRAHLGAITLLHHSALCAFFRIAEADSVGDEAAAPIGAGAEELVGATVGSESARGADRAVDFPVSEFRAHFVNDFDVADDGLQFPSRVDHRLFLRGAISMVVAVDSWSCTG